MQVVCRVRIMVHSDSIAELESVLTTVVVGVSSFDRKPSLNGPSCREVIAVLKTPIWSVNDRAREANGLIPAIEIISGEPNGPNLWIIRRVINDSIAEATLGVVCTIDASSIDMAICSSNRWVGESPSHLVSIGMCLPFKTGGLINGAILNELVKMVSPECDASQLHGDTHGASRLLK